MGKKLRDNPVMLVDLTATATSLSLCLGSVLLQTVSKPTWMILFLYYYMFFFLKKEECQRKPEICQYRAEIESTTIEIDNLLRSYKDLSEDIYALQDLITKGTLYLESIRATAGRLYTLSFVIGI